MSDAKEVVLKCQNCLKDGKTISKRMHPVTWIILIVIMGGLIVFLDYPFIGVCYDLFVGNVGGSQGVIFLTLVITTTCILVTGILAGMLIRDFKRRDYWIFTDKNGDAHCDTVCPTFHNGNYYWQPHGGN